MAGKFERNSDCWWTQANGSERAKWRKGWDSNPRGAYTPGGFQDRCLKPLGHPSADNIEYLRIAAGTTNVNVAAELPAPAPNPARADVRYLGPGGLILNKRGAPRKARAIDTLMDGPALAPFRDRATEGLAPRKRKTPLRRGASPRFGVCQDSSGIGGI